MEQVRSTPRTPGRHRACRRAVVIGLALVASIAPAGPVGAEPTGVVAPAPTGASGATPTTTYGPTGAYRTVRSGTTEVDGRRISWSLRRAPGSGGTTCWRFEAKPAAKSAGSNAPGGARCSIAPAADADPVDRPWFVQSNARSAPYGFLAFVVPKGTTKVRVGTEGGRFRTVSGSSPFVVVNGRDPLWVDLTLPDRTRLSCAAGVLIDRSDLRDPILTRPSVGAAWFCDEP